MIRRAAVLSAAAILLVGCSGESPAEDMRTDEAAGSTAGVTTIQMAAIGDSITDADSPDFASGSLGPGSWVSYAVGDGVEFAGGWAEWGATTAEMAQSTPELEADVLVILAGTNDIFGLEHDQIGANIVAIADAAHVSDVVLSSIPPIDTAAAEVAALNASLELLAGEQNWTWVDSSAGLRDVDGGFAAGMADDGVHPTQAGAQLMGEAIREAVLDAAGT